MVACSTCGLENRPQSRFCTNCGNPLEADASGLPSVVYCTYCGAENPSTARFCPNCGTALRVSPTRGMQLEAWPPTAVEYMGFWIRFAALIIDGIIYGIALYVWVLLTLFVPILGILAIPVVIYAFYKEIKCQTVGKRLLGIKVVSESGQDISFWRGLLRESIGKFISGIIVYLGYIWVAFDSHKQGWHDKIADTYVIRR